MCLIYRKDVRGQELESGVTHWRWYRSRWWHSVLPIHLQLGGFPCQGPDLLFSHDYDKPFIVLQQAPRPYNDSGDDAFGRSYPNEKVHQNTLAWLCFLSCSPANPSGMSLQAPRQYHDDDDDGDVLDGDDQSVKRSDDTSAAKPLKNPLPPLPERPAAGKRRTASSKPSAAVSKDDSSNAQTSSQTQGAKTPEAQSSAAAVKPNREPGQL